MGRPGLDDGTEKLDTHRKALRVNLDRRRYGTFAEIGAGQEVVRWFFRVGAAAGTIAKSISAYDMTVSDAIYGPCGRYVARPRLQAMLDYEYDLTLQRLKESRGDTTAFFAFADTVRARSYQGSHECHGWMGIKFQSHPRDDSSQIVLHVRMLDTENALQQEALGIVGVNLIYGAFFLSHDPDLLIESLLDNLTIDRLEIDMIEFTGIEFRHVDNRMMSLKLVELGLSKAAMFAADGTVLQPSEVLYRKSILIERGSFRPVTHVNVDMMKCAHEQFIQDPDVKPDSVVQLMEITMHNLLATGEIDYRDFLQRVDVMASLGLNVLISDYSEYYRLAAYLSLHTDHKIGIVMGVPSLMELFDPKYYEHLAGGILESFGRLFKRKIKLFVYPYRDSTTGALTTVDNFPVPDGLVHLYHHLVHNGLIEQLQNYNEDYLHIFSRDILRRIRAGDESWQQMVPPPVAEVIKSRGLFGYHRRLD